MTALFSAYKISQFRALGDHIVVEEMNFAERLTSSGIILKSDNAKSEGIRPRWGRVYAVGPEQHEIQVGQWVCVEHGRWTRGLDVEDETGTHTIRRVDPEAIMLVSDSEPGADDTMSDAVIVAARAR